MTHLLTRSISLLLAVFAASGTRASVEDRDPRAQHATSAATGEAAPRGAQTPSAPATTLWPQRIEDRLAALAAIRRGSAAEPTPAAHALDQELHAIARAAGGRARLAIHVRDLDSGTQVFDLEGDRMLNPASNHKLVTAIAALELLGPDYQFETRVARDADTLYVVGEGDPSLQVDDLYGLAEKVASLTDASTIRRIVFDDSAFSSRRFGPGYDGDGPGVSYMAPSGALSMQFNVVEITVRPGQFGEPLAVQIDPPCAHVEVESKTTTGSSRPLVVDSRSDGTRTLVTVEGGLLAGHAPVVFRKRVTDPGRYTASAFADILARMLGTSVLDVERGIVPDDALAITTHRSAPLHEVLSPAMKFSNNFTTEQVLRTVAWRATGQPGDWREGRRIIARFWSAAGLPTDALVFENASGLSRNGRVSAAALVELLALTARDGSPSQTLLPALPVAGRDGTLRHRLETHDGRVRAKTGTLSNAGALTGMVASTDGRRHLGFSVLVNGGLDARRSRRLQDRIVVALLAHADGE